MRTKKTAPITMLQVNLVEAPAAALFKPALLIGGDSSSLSVIRAYRIRVICKDGHARGAVLSYEAELMHNTESMWWWPAHEVRPIGWEERNKPSGQDPWQRLFQANQEELPAVTPLPIDFRHEEPLYQAGQPVWAVVEDPVAEDPVTGVVVVSTRVIAWNLVVTADDRSVFGLFDGYCCGSAPADARDFSPFDVFATKAKALDEVKFVRVIATKKEWLAAIGTRDGNSAAVLKSVEESELGTSGTDTSDIRTTLLTCQKQAGLHRRDVKILAEQLQQCDPPEETEVLDMILAQLGLTWTAQPDEDE